MTAVVPPTAPPKLKTGTFAPSTPSTTVVPGSQVDKVADENGVVKIRSGQMLGASLFSAIQSAYQNLVYHPIALSLLVLSMLLLYKPPTGQESLFVIARKALEVKQAAIEFPPLKSVPAVIALILKYLEKFSVQFSYICLVSVPYIVKPSNRNLWMAVILAFVFWLKHVPEMEIIMFSQLFYLYVMLRSPSHRLIIALLTLLFLLSSYFQDPEIFKPKA